MALGKKFSFFSFLLLLLLYDARGTATCMLHLVLFYVHFYNLKNKKNYGEYIRNLSERISQYAYSKTKYINQDIYDICIYGNNAMKLPCM